MSDIQKDSKSSLNDVRYDPLLFHNSEQIFLLYKKIEAVTGALFLVTGTISDTDAIKNNIRQGGLALLSKIITLISKRTIETADFHEISSSSLHLYSLLDIAFWSGTLSQMNTSLIQREVNLIYRVANDLIAKHKSTFYFDEAFFSKTEGLQKTLETKRKIVPEKVSPVSESHPSIGHIKDNIKDTIGHKNDLEDRQSLIVNLVKQKGTISIKDAATVIPTVSEKTIQRELLAMVAKGLLIKNGERRWSTYSLPL